MVEAPKSATLQVQSLVTSRFCGLRSRWITTSRASQRAQSVRESIREQSDADD